MNDENVKRIGENEFGRGCLPSPPDSRDYRLSAFMDMPSGSGSDDTFPKSYKVPWLPNIKNQGKINSCTAFALSYIFECINRKMCGQADVFSTGYLYGNRRETTYTGEGQIMRDSVKGAYKHGDVKATVWDNNLEVPEAIETFEKEYEKLHLCSRRLIKGYVRIREEEEAKAFMYRYGIPLYVNTRTKYVNPLSGGNGLHAMVATEYSFDHIFKCQNSWGDRNCPHPEIEFENFNEVWGIVPMEEVKFTDVEETRWSAEAIKTAATDGIVAGYPDGSFKPAQNLTREEVAVMWERMKRYCEERYAKKL